MKIKKKERGWGKMEEKELNKNFIKIKINLL
jgi:hypothetical protein